MKAFLKKTFFSWAWWRSWLFSWRFWWGRDNHMVADVVPVKNTEFTVSVVIPAHDEKPFIMGTVKSILRQDYPIKQIIVVDSWSSDGTGDWVKKFAHKLSTRKLAMNPGFVVPDILVVRDEYNGRNTKSSAQNVGIEFVSSDLVNTVDADTILEPNAVRTKLRFFRDPKAFAVSGFVRQKNIRDWQIRRPIAEKILPVLKQQWQELRKAKDTTWKVAYKKWADYKRANTLSIWELGRFIEYLYCLAIIKPAQHYTDGIIVACGCDTMFRTNLVRKLGGFKPDTLVEDMDLTWEGKAAGYRVYHAPDSICYSMEPTTLRMTIKQGARWDGGLFQLLKKYRFNVWPVGKKTALFAYYYIISGVIAPFTLPFVLVAYSNGNWLTMLQTLPVLLAYILAVQVFGVWLWVIPTALRMNMFWLSVQAIIPGIIVQYVKHYIYLRAIWMEVVLNKTLTKWDKGHAEAPITT